MKPEDLYHTDWNVGIDESELNKVDRLGLACCRLSCWEWDDILGPKPDGFDDLPKYDQREGRLFHKKQPSRDDFIDKPYRAIVSIIGEANESRCWWKFVLKKSEAEWFRWYTTGCYLEEKGFDKGGG